MRENHDAHTYSERVLEPPHGAVLFRRLARAARSAIIDERRGLGVMAVLRLPLHAFESSVEAPRDNDTHVKHEREEAYASRNQGKQELRVPCRRCFARVRRRQLLAEGQAASLKQSNQ